MGDDWEDAPSVGVSPHTAVPPVNDDDWGADPDPGMPISQQVTQPVEQIPVVQPPMGVPARPVSLPTTGSGKTLRELLRERPKNRPLAQAAARHAPQRPNPNESWDADTAPVENSTVPVPIPADSGWDTPDTMVTAPMPPPPTSNDDWDAPSVQFPAGQQLGIPATQLTPPPPTPDGLGAGTPVYPTPVQVPMSEPNPVLLVDSATGEVLGPVPEEAPGKPKKKRDANTVKADAAKASKVKTGGSKTPSTNIGGLRLTERDYRIMGFLARYRIATVGQLARFFETSQTAFRNRLPRLEKAGLVTWAWSAQAKPKVWLITEAGLATVGMHLTAPTVRWGQLRHTLGLADLGINFELAGEVVLTEREIRAAATRYTPTARMKSAIDLSNLTAAFLNKSGPVDEETDLTAHAIRSALTVQTPGSGFGHIPDMVLVRQPFPNGASGNIAIELELTRKALSAWKTILTAYRDSPVFHEVYYFVTSSEIQRSLNAVIGSIGAASKIHVVAWTPIDNTADPYTTGG